MKLPRSSLLLVFTISCLAATAPLGAVSLALGADGLVEAAQGLGYGAKLQAFGALALRLEVPLTPWLDLVPSLDYEGALPSDAAGGFLYRGWAGAAVALGIDMKAAVGRDASGGLFLAGGGIGAAAVLPYYTRTTLYFFFPELRAAAFLEWRPADPAGLQVRISLPVRVQLRRDMTLSAGAGLGLSVGTALGGRS
jgi:hypothetical protein